MIGVAKIRDTAEVRLVDGVPKRIKARTSNAPRSGRVQSWQVDRRVWKYAMDLVGGDGKRIRPIDETSVYIFPEE